MENSRLKTCAGENRVSWQCTKSFSSDAITAWPIERREEKSKETYGLVAHLCQCSVGIVELAHRVIDYGLLDLCLVLRRHCVGPRIILERRKTSWLAGDETPTRWDTRRLVKEDQGPPPRMQIRGKKKKDALLVARRSLAVA